MHDGLWNRLAPILAFNDVANFVDTILVDGVDIDADLAPRGSQRNIHVGGQTDLSEEAAYAGLKSLPVGWQWIVDTCRPRLCVMHPRSRGPLHTSTAVISRHA